MSFDWHTDADRRDSRLKTAGKACLMAWSFYSVIPMPKSIWSKRASRYVLLWFWTVGLGLGVVLSALIRIGQSFHLSPWIGGGILLVCSVWWTGGIHLDGFGDVMDALGSHQSPKRQLEIMKDPHVGSFAVIGLVLYLVTAYGFWVRLYACRSISILMALPALFVLSRGLTAWFALTLKKARSDGMLVQVTPREKYPFRHLLWIGNGLALFVLFLASPTCLALAVWLGLWTGHYLWLCLKRYGGTTGDLSGYYLCGLEWLGLMWLAICLV